MTQPDKRAQWVGDYAELVTQLRAKTWPSDTILSDRMDAIGAEYGRTLVDAPASRCPFCKKPVVMSWDPVGLDGPWWCHWYPYRGPRKPICEHYLAVVGAVTLPAQPPFTPYLVTPGPGVPYVVPMLLTGLSKEEAIGVEPDDFPELRRSAGSRPTVRAVISSLDVGGAPAYAIHYFGQPVTPDQLALQSWGADDLGESLYVRADEQQRKLRLIFDDDCDFDLQPWLDEGFVQWIAPGDDSLTLQTNPSTCPYVEMPGTRSHQYLQEGSLWLDSDD